MHTPTDRTLQEREQTMHNKNLKEEAEEREHQSERLE